ncbi:class I SAM-dependent methyltransferase [Streptomyces sp. NPDC002265]|uniref:class I SAM-dependent methyltransferase n=1 Tax=Streptomyces sp. NPDC002265 TaxID=3154415 RepID=UPI0033318005
MTHPMPHPAHSGAHSAHPAHPHGQQTRHEHRHEHEHEHGHDADQSEVLDLDAEVLAEHLAFLTRWLPVREAPRRIVDLGAGTGAGTFALLECFPEARVTAVDSSAAHLDRLHEKARAQGVGDRVRTVRADLDTEWPDLGTPELVWASASVHHMADPARTLRQVHGALAPGGLFAVVELAGFPRFLPVDAPEDAPGLLERCHAAAERPHAAHVPHRGTDWGPVLADAGFTVEAERTVTVNVDSTRSPAVGRYALAGLRRLRASVGDELSPADLAALDRLLDPVGPQGILRRDDLAVRTERTVWAARR